MRVLSLAVLALALVIALRGQAQPEASRASGYPGVVPGTDHRPPRVAPTSAGARARLVTWPGFQQLDDGATRFFIQTSGPVEIEQSVEANRVVITLKNTRAGLRNNLRPLETRHFATPVVRAQPFIRGRNTQWVLELREPSTPVVRTEQAENGYFFVFVEFPPTAARAAEAAPRRRSQASDGERPPAMRGKRP